MEQKTLDTRAVTIDGQRGIYRPARSVLPPMPVLLRTLRNARLLSRPIFAGYRSDCGEGNHRLTAWLTGLYGLREILLNRCLDCEMAEVRDISIDRIPGLPTGRLALRRKSDLLGWYSGARSNKRVYL